MAFMENPFSLPDLFDHLHVSSHEGGISASVSPLRFPSRLHAQLFNIMTCEEHVVFFNTELDKSELRGMAFLLTSDSDYFLEIVTNKLGSKHVQNLLGKSDDVDALFCDAIKRKFLHIMTDKYASHVAVRAMVVFNKEKKTTMYDHILFNALDIACDQHGCIALNHVITDMDDDKDYRHSVLELITHNVLILSKHESGNSVVQHVLQLNYLQYKYNIVYNLSGHFVELSFNKYGSKVVEKILETEEKSMVVVVIKELSKCKEDTLITLAMNEFGNYVVFKALRLTRERFNIDLFDGLVDKLIPSLPLLRGCHGTNIANMVDSFIDSGLCAYV